MFPCRRCCGRLPRCCPCCRAGFSAGREHGDGSAPTPGARPARPRHSRRPSPLPLGRVCSRCWYYPSDPPGKYSTLLVPYGINFSPSNIISNKIDNWMMRSKWEKSATSPAWFRAQWNRMDLTWTNSQLRLPVRWATVNWCRADWWNLGCHRGLVRVLQTESPGELIHQGCKQAAYYHSIWLALFLNISFLKYSLYIYIDIFVCVCVCVCVCV